MKTLLLLSLILSTPGSNCAHSFVHPANAIPSTVLAKQQKRTIASTPKNVFPGTAFHSLSSLVYLRGGGGVTSATSMTAAMDSVAQTLSHVVTSNSPLGPLGLWAVASAVVVPLTVYRQGYAFSVGYGFSIAAMALYMMQQFPGSTLNPLVLSAVFQGVRLATYLLLREFSSSEKKQQVKSFDKSPRWKRIPFAASVSLFYAFLMTPILYVLRSSANVSSSNNIVLTTGAFLAWCGAILEAIADYHKFLVKQKHQSDTNKFVGPTSGVYRITRHPNYTGEVLYYFGVLVSGIPFFNAGGSIPNKVVGWVLSGLGFYGIFSIMTTATKRLDEKQKEKYGGQKAYDKWRGKVQPPLFPFVNVE